MEHLEQKINHYRIPLLLEKLLEAEKKGEVISGKELFGECPNLHEEYADAYVQELQTKITNYAKNMKN